MLCKTWLKKVLMQYKVQYFQEVWSLLRNIYIFIEGLKVKSDRGEVAVKKIILVLFNCNCVTMLVMSFGVINHCEPVAN